MAEDRRKMLEALAAKRKAEAAGGGSAHRQKSIGPLSKVSPALKSNPPSHKPSSLLKPQKHHHHKKEIPPMTKKKRVEKYDTEDDDDEDEDESGEDSDSDDEHLKKKLASSKSGGPPPKASSFKPSPVKAGQEKRGKPVVKEPAKGKRKSKDSSDDDDGGSGDEDEEAAGPDSGDEGLDAGNILPSRTRRHNAQPVHYDFTNMSGDDDDDSD